MRTIQNSRALSVANAKCEAIMREHVRQERRMIMKEEICKMTT